MKSSAIKRLIFLSMSTFTSLSAYTQTSCTCQPSPPGATTICRSGENAFCRVDNNGVCTGSCDTISSRFAPLEYYKNLLAVAIRKQIDTAIIYHDPKTQINNIDSILYSTTFRRTVTLKYFEDYKLTVNLTQDATNKVKSAREQFVYLLRTKKN